MRDRGTENLCVASTVVGTVLENRFPYGTSTIPTYCGLTAVILPR